ncbi:MAG: hypothetical protein AB2L26_00950 [Ignavibacteria bacterium]
MINKVVKIFFCVVFLYSGVSYSQVKDTRSKPFTKYSTWLLLQAIPSPGIISDANDDNARVQFSLKWQITPLNISFKANKYVSPVQFFMINPVRRFTGSAELFIQPEVVTSSFKYSGFDRFGLNTGARVIIPVQEMGENIAVSLGGKYTFRKNTFSGDNGYAGVEAGVYFIGGLFGLQFTKNFNANNLYSASFYFKYY